MKKYMAIFLLSIIGLTGFYIYNNNFKPWSEAEKYKSSIKFNRAFIISFYEFLYFSDKYFIVSEILEGV